MNQWQFNNLKWDLREMIAKDSSRKNLLWLVYHYGMYVDIYDLLNEQQMCLRNEVSQGAPPCPRTPSFSGGNESQDSYQTPKIRY